VAFNLGDIFVTFKSNTDGLKKGINEANNKIDSVKSSVGKLDFKAFATKASTAFGSVAGVIENVAKKVFMFGTASSLGVGAFVKSAADLQVASKSFEILIGNAARANSLFAELKRFADETPFEFPQLAKGARTLLGYGINVEDVMGRLKMLGDIAAVTGADFNSLAVVFGQVNGAGRLMGQDALQLINNNIPITTIMTKKLGLNLAGLAKNLHYVNDVIHVYRFTL